MTDAHALHDEILAARRARHASEHRLAVLLARLRSERLFLDLGYATVYDYARVILDLDVRKTRALLQLGSAMGDLPALDRAFAAGEIGWTKAREVLRVATPDTVDAWVDRARDVTSRTLEHQVSGALIGEAPPNGDDEPRAPARQRLVFEVESADAQVIRDVLALVRGQTGDPDVEDGVLLAMIAERVLRDVDPAEAPTGESYRKVLVHCVRCGETTGVGADVTDTVVAEAECDHEAVVGVPGPEHGHLTRAIPPARRRAVLARDGYRCVVPGCTCRIWLHLHHARHRARGGDHALANLVTLCSAHHRMVHLGLLGVWRERDGSLVFSFPERPARRRPRGSPFAPDTAAGPADPGPATWVTRPVAPPSMS